MKKTLMIMLLMAATMTSTFAQGNGEGKWILKTSVGAGNYFGYEDGAGDKIMALDLGISYGVKDYLSLGVATGITGPYDASSLGVFAIPILADATFCIPNNSAWTPYLQLRAGYAFNTAKNVTICKETFKTSNYATIDIVPGVVWNFNEDLGLIIALKYERMMKVGKNWGSSGNYFIPQIGIAYNW